MYGDRIEEIRLMNHTLWMNQPPWMNECCRPFVKTSDWNGRPLAGVVSSSSRSALYATKALPKGTRLAELNDIDPQNRC